MNTFIWAIALSTVFSLFMRSFTSAGNGVFWGREKGGEGMELRKEEKERGGRGEEEGICYTICYHSSQRVR